MTKVFLVTGCSRGLGRSISVAVLEAGHQLIATARRPEQLSDLVVKYGDQVRAVRLDVTDLAAAQSAVQVAIGSFGRLDVVVNNAGYARFASVEDIEIEDFREQLDTNLMGVVNVTKAALPVMRAQGEGHIIQISSVGSRTVTPGLSAYHAAKWAVSGFSALLAREVNPLGIKVTALEPGGISTNGTVHLHPVSGPYKQSLGPVRDALERGLPATSDPHKVALAVLRLAQLDEVPERLLIGSDAVAKAGAYNLALAESDARWIGLTISTNHHSRPEITPA